MSRAKLFNITRLAKRRQPPPERIVCGKCGFDSGDSYAFCEGACPMPCSPHFDPQVQRIVALEQALALLITSQEEWEQAISKIIGRPPQVFERHIDKAKTVLADKPISRAGKGLPARAVNT